MKILVIGGVSYDEIVTMDQLPNGLPTTLFGRSRHMVGSTGVGKALALTKLGIPCTLQSPIGLDEAGQIVRAYLTKNHVDCVFDSVAETERHINLMDAEGKRISIFVATIPSRIDMDKKRMTALIAEADLIVLNIIPYAKSLIGMIKASGKPVWTDLHDYEPGNPYYEEFIDIAETVFFSDDRFTDYMPFMEKLITDGKRLVVVTHGKKGATALDQHRRLHYEAIVNDFDAIDTNGAGDSFFAGYLYGYLQGCSIDTSLKYGAIAGGMAVASYELVNQDLSAEALVKIYHKYYEE
jgi:sugar/nucleoside kinase (ribokinase family)